ncbi:MAG: LacI family DNA-binding transcriptional regulator [Eubacteriales bacterium]|nr:LacI family DNA-binding transcriptional regulator [Eubacteriales bacterium]
MSVTIRDVAKHAGVSVATVSRYLNNSPLIAQESVDKVRNSIQALHYEPSFLARGMVIQRSQTVAFLVDDENPDTFGNDSFLKIQYGAERALGEHGYYLMILSVGSAAREKALRKIVVEKRIDGVILPAQLAKKTLCAMLTEQDVPFVLIGKSKFSNWIDLDNVMAGRIAAEKLIAAGAGSLCFVGNGSDKVFVNERYEGFSAAVHAQANIVAELPRIDCKSGAVCGYDLITSAKELPDAFVVSDNETAFGMLRALDERSVKVPDQIQMISFDDGIVARLCHPMLSVVDIDVKQLGIQAANMLYLQLQAGRDVSQQCLMPVRLISRETSR